MLAPSPIKARKIAAAITGLLALSLPVAACGSSAGPSASASATAHSAATTAGSPTAVSILSYPTSGASWLAYIATKEGFFAKNGINASLNSLAAGQQGTAAMASGAIDVGLLDVSNMGPLLAHGQKYTLLTNGIVNFWTLVGKKNLAGDRTNLKAALESVGSISVPSLGGSGARDITLLESAYGISPDKISIIASPGPAAFLSGRVGGFMTDTLQSCQAIDLGYPDLMNFVQPVAPKSTYPAQVRNLMGLAGLGYWVTDSWLSAHPGVAAKFQKSIAEAIAWSQDPKNVSTIASLFRGTTWDLPKLNESQWQGCVKRVVATFNDAFSATDVSTWNAILKSEGVAPLPARSQFMAPGVPES